MADDDETIEEAIERSAKGPKKMTGDTGSVEQHPIADQIAADEYVNSKAASRRGLGIRHVKMIPPGGE